MHAKTSKKAPKKEHQDESKEVDRDVKKAIKGKKKVTGPKDNYEKKPKVGPSKRTTSNGYMPH